MLLITSEADWGRGMVDFQEIPPPSKLIRMVKPNPAKTGHQ